MNLPNKLTLTRILLSPVFMVFFLIEDVYSRYFATLIFLVAALTDLYDGYIARKYRVVTGFGKFMDPLADKILVSTAFISFVALGYVKAWMILVIIVREFFITGLRSLAAYKGMVIIPTILAQVKTFSQMLVISIILVFTNIETTLIPQGYNLGFLFNPLIYRIFDILVFICMILTVITGIDYLVKNLPLLKGVLK